MYWLEMIADWLGKHPLTLAALTLVAGGLISIFSGDIREFLRIQPERLSIWILKARASAAKSRLELLQTLHQDRRELFLTLVLYLFILSGIVIFLLIGIFLEVRWGEVRYPFDRWEHVVNAKIAFSVFGIAGVIFTRAMQRIFALMYWDRTRERLETKINRLNKKIEAKSSTSKAASI